MNESVPTKSRSGAYVTLAILLVTVPLDDVVTDVIVSESKSASVSFARTSITIEVLLAVVTKSSFATGEVLMSTVIPTAVDGGDVFPAASVAFAVMLWAPSASDDDVIDQVVRLSRGMDPIEVEPSNITIDVSATFIPFIVGVDVVTVVPLAGLVIAGDCGGAVSSVKVVPADPVLPAVSVACTKTR